ncbi:hypothetical protein ABPG72_015776 [Tetrahymena utriculariae]
MVKCKQTWNKDQKQHLKYQKILNVVKLMLYIPISLRKSIQLQDKELEQQRLKKTLKNFLIIQMIIIQILNLSSEIIQIILLSSLTKIKIICTQIMFVKDIIQNFMIIFNSFLLQSMYCKQTQILYLVLHLKFESLNSQKLIKKNQLIIINAKLTLEGNLVRIHMGYSLILGQKYDIRFYSLNYIQAI